MAHVRQQIREAAAAALTGLTTSGARVFQTRLHPLDAASLPCLLVNTDDEDVNASGLRQPYILSRNLTLSVRAVAKASSNLDDILDGMIGEVEAALGNTLLGILHDLKLETISIEIEPGDKPVGIALMKFTGAYVTAGNAPQTAI